jgi:hypothetical protein
MSAPPLRARTESCSDVMSRVESVMRNEDPFLLARSGCESVSLSRLVGDPRAE